MKLWKSSVLALALGLAAVGVQAQSTEEITDTLERVKSKGLVFGCAYPYTFPSAEVNANPPGYDVEIFRELAKRGGMQIQMHWVTTRSRASVQRAYRESILAKRCDVFLNLGESSDEDDATGMSEMAFTKPHMSQAYVLAVQGKADGMKSIEEVHQAGIKIGVNMSTPADGWLFDAGIPRSLYFGEARMIKAMAEGEIDAALMWSPTIGAAKREFPKAAFHLVQGYEPLPEHRYNTRFGVRKADESLLKFLNEGIDELTVNGTIKKIVESYNVPYYAPISK